MNTDFESFAADVDALAFIEKLMQECGQFSVAQFEGEWVISWPTKARKLCPSEASAYEEE